MKKCIFTSIAVLALGASLAHGATLIDFTMAEHNATNNTTVVLTDTSTLAAGISSPTAKRSVGAIFTTGGGGTQAGEINWAGWTTDSEFLVVELTVDTGYTVDLTDLTMDVSRNGSGAPTNFYAVVLPGTGLGGAALGAGTHLDVQTPLISGNAGGSAGQTRSWDLNSVGTLAAGSYTIGWGTENGAGGNMRVSDIVVNGTVVPEPSALALFGIASLALILRRRK